MEAATSRLCRDPERLRDQMRELSRGRTCWNSGAVLKRYNALRRDSSLLASSVSVSSKLSCWLFGRKRAAPRNVVSPSRDSVSLNVIFPSVRSNLIRAVSVEAPSPDAVLAVDDVELAAAELSAATASVKKSCRVLSSALAGTTGSICRCSTLLSWLNQASLGDHRRAFSAAIRVWMRSCVG